MKKLFILIILHFLIFSNRNLQAQWVLTNGPYVPSAIHLAASGDIIFAGADESGVYLSTDGMNWTSAGLVNNFVQALAFNGATIFAGTDWQGIYVSTNNGTNWVYTGLKAGLFSAFTFRATKVFACGGGGVWCSEINNINWVSRNNGLPSLWLNTLAISGNIVFVGTSNGVYLSTDDGMNWTSAGLTNTQVLSLAVSGTNIFAGLDTSMYFSTDNGTNWIQINNGLYYKARIYSLIVIDSNIFAGTANGVYLSTNNGTNWTQINDGLTDLYISSLAVFGTNIFAGSWHGGVWKRPLSDFATPVELTSFTANINSGTVSLKWTTATETNNRGFEIQRKSSNYDFVTVAFINGNGTSTKPNHYSWSEKMQHGIYTYRLKQVDYNGKFEYSKEVKISVAPNDFSLEQNYPNPFNPSTVISYSLPLSSNVKLIVYNTLGQTISILENGFKSAGNYSVNFNASGLSSGIYYYKLEAGQFSQVKKMILIK